MMGTNSYSLFLRSSIKSSGLTLDEICTAFKKSNVRIAKPYLSKLQNGKVPPASNKTNELLAGVLGIDPLELISAAYKEKIPPEVFQRLCSSKFGDENFQMNLYRSIDRTLEFGSIIKKIRIEKGLTSKYVSDRLGISASTLSKYESNERNVKAEMVPLIARVLNVTIEEIYKSYT